MHGKLRQVLPHGVMLIVAVLLYWAATRIEVDTGGRISPALWPKAVIVFMGLLCAYEIVKRLVAKGGISAKGLLQDFEHAPPQPAPPPANNRMLAGGIAAIAAYVMVVPWTGFFLTTALFLAVFPWIGGVRRPLASAIIGLVGSLVLVVVFMRIAYISLPLGEGIFRAVSLALMRAIGVS